MPGAVFVDTERVGRDETTGTGRRDAQSELGDPDESEVVTLDRAREHRAVGAVVIDRRVVKDEHVVGDYVEVPVAGAGTQHGRRLTLTGSRA